MNWISWLLLGYSICSTIVWIVLANKPTYDYNIDNLKQKNKRNKDSTIDNDISANINIKQPDKREQRRTKRQNKRLTKKKKDGNT